MTEIEQIKVALAKVDEGTWIAQEDCQNCRGNGVIIFNTEAGFERDECSCLIPENRMFNANAPEYISSLITTIESLQEQKEAQRLDYLALHEDFLKQKEEIEKLREIQRSKQCKHGVNIDWICVECIDEEIERERK